MRVTFTTTSCIREKVVQRAVLMQDNIITFEYMCWFKIWEFVEKKKKNEFAWGKRKQMWSY